MHTARRTVTLRAQRGRTPPSAAAARLDAVDAAEALQQVEAVTQRKDVQKGHRAVLQLVARPAAQHVEVRRARGQADSAPAPEDHVQEVDALVPHQQSPEARGVAEHFVEAEAHEVGWRRREVERLRGHEGSSVQQDLPDLMPGMEVQVDIVTGERRIIEYFVDPIIATARESFREL